MVDLLVGRVLSRKISNKRVNAAKLGIGFMLTVAQIKFLLKEARITIEDWKFSGYHLSRFGDKGDYVFGNCRFIPAEENFREKKISDKSREASRRNIVRGNALKTSEQRHLYAVLGGLASGRRNKLTVVELKQRFEKVKHLRPFERLQTKTVASVLGCTGQHVRRLRKRWLSLGLNG